LFSTSKKEFWFFDTLKRYNRIWDNYEDVQQMIHPKIEKGILLINKDYEKRIHLFVNSPFPFSPRDSVFDVVLDIKELVYGTNKVKRIRWYYWSIDYPLTKGYVRSTTQSKLTKFLTNRFFFKKQCGK